MGTIYSIDCPKNLTTLTEKKAGFLARKAAVSVVLSLLFIVVYGGASYLAKITGAPPGWHFSWERAIPVIPWMIVPYMSIDLFFVGAPFLCRNWQELGVFTQRIVVGILIAGVFFVVMPMQFAFERPVVDGVFGLIFKFLHGFDRPYNMLPSLHIILRTILAHHYAKRAQGFGKWLIHGWFSLIGFSTIFTHQHHLPDILAGFLVAGLIFYLCPESTKDKKRNEKRIGFYYLMLSVLFSGLALRTGGFGLILAWPGMAMLLVALAYFGNAEMIFRKRSGKLPFLDKILLAPWYLGQSVYMQFYRKKCNAWDYVTEDVIIGRKLSKKEAEKLIFEGVSAVVDLTVEFEEIPALRALNYHCLKVMDLTAPSQGKIAETMRFIAENIDNGGKVYVHCKLGYSRSAAVVIAWLIYCGKAKDYQDAVKILKKARPSLIIRPEIERMFKKADE